MDTLSCKIIASKSEYWFLSRRQFIKNTKIALISMSYVTEISHIIAVRPTSALTVLY